LAVKNKLAEELMSAFKRFGKR